MSFIHPLRSEGLTWEGLGVELLFLHIERNQLRWHRATVSDAHWMPTWRGGVPLGGAPGVDPGHTRVPVTRLAWECLEILPEELYDWVSLKMDGWIDWVWFRVLLT